jgi:ketosteroid isomerase-like protein
MNNHQPIDVVLAFLDRINAGDVPGMCELMTEDHIFVDALGNQVKGRETMRKGWAGYFKLFPDYKVSHEEIFAQSNVVAAFGSAQGTYAPDGQLSKEKHWNIPAAWKAVVRDGQIAEWYVYADNQPARKLMGERIP